MDPILAGGIAIAALLFLVAIRVPVAFAMLGVGFAGLCFLRTPLFALIQLQTVPYALVASYTFVVVPMFVLMGSIAAESGLIKDLYHAADLWLERLKGSLYYATVVGSTLFAAISGSTIVNSAMFTRVALPEMIKFKYHRGFSAGCIAGVGTLAALIPPSLSFVIYGILTEQSIGQLLIAGVIPGVLTAVMFILVIKVTLWIRPNWAPQPVARHSFRERFRSLGAIWPVTILILLVLGGIYTGVLPPSAAGAVGAVGALIISLLRRSISAPGLRQSLEATISMTTVIFIILIGGMLFSRFLLASGFVNEMNMLVSDNAVSTFLFMASLVVVYFVLGMFVDPMSMMVMTLPVFFPISQALDIDPIWFGVIVIKLVEIAVITPPVGMNLFAVVSGAEGKVKTSEVFVGVLPFLVAELLALSVLFLFPSLATFLPEQMVS